jgi:hypothetical protein
MNTFNFDLNKQQLLSNQTNSNLKFIKLCKIGNLEIAKKLYDLGGINIHERNNEAFRSSCKSGHIETAKWLYDLGGINIHAEDDEAFRFSCEKGQIEVAKWLYDLGDINIHAQDDYAFRSSCWYGQIQVVKWLYDLGGININAFDDDTFIASCFEGQIEIAKWLYDLGGINIHAHDDYAFRWSCENGYFETAKWLCTICPNYQIKISDNNIESIILTEKDRIMILLKKNKIDEIKEMFKTKKEFDKHNLAEKECNFCLEKLTVQICVQIKCNHVYHLNCVCKYTNNNCILRCTEYNENMFDNTLLI